MDEYIKRFSEIGIRDIAIVGGKNASLGEMFNALSPKGILVPKGFAITSNAFREFLEYNHLEAPLKKLLASLDQDDYSNLADTGFKARQMILSAKLPQDLSLAITTAYELMFEEGTQEVAVRSSATAEDLPQANFAGQHESYLNVKGSYSLLCAVRFRPHHGQRNYLA